MCAWELHSEQVQLEMNNKTVEHSLLPHEQRNCKLWNTKLLLINYDCVNTQNTLNAWMQSPMSERYTWAEWWRYEDRRSKYCQLELTYRNNTHSQQDGRPTRWPTTVINEDNSWHEWDALTIDATLRAIHFVIEERRSCCLNVRRSHGSPSMIPACSEHSTFKLKKLEKHQLIFD